MSTIKEHFAEKFKDITHFGCPSTPEVVCGTLRRDLLTFFHQELLTLAEEIEAKKIKSPWKTALNGSQAEQIMKDHDIYNRSVMDAAALIRAKAKELSV